MNILVVDDSESMRRIIIRMLNAMGYNNVAQAENGIDAVNTVRRQAVDLILLDWNMPKMDGLATVKHLREQGNRTPIVMVTTEGERSKVVTAAKAGVTNYILKPFDQEVLERIVNSVLKPKAA